MCIVKLRRGSGKDRQAMAPKAKGLKASKQLASSSQAVRKQFTSSSQAVRKQLASNFWLRKQHNKS